MIFGYISIRVCTILVAILNIISCETYGCPSFYHSPSNDSLQAIMEVPTPNNHNNVINFYVQLSVGNTVNTEVKIYLPLL